MNTRKTSEYISPPVLLLFLGLTFGLTWAFMIPAAAEEESPVFLPLIILAAFGPFLAAVITQWLFRGKSGLLQWLRKMFNPRIPVFLYLAGAFLLPLLFGGLHFILYALLGGEIDLSNAAPWYLYLAHLIPTALLSGGNEEPGWRGFALPALLQWFPPMIATLVLGIVHAAWHLPLMDHYQTGFGIYAFNLIGLTFLLNWFYLKSRGSIIPVMLLHAATNVIGEFLPTPMTLLGGTVSDLLLRGVVYWTIALALIVLTRGRLGYERQTRRS